MDMRNLYVTPTYFQYNRSTINTTLQTVADIILGAWRAQRMSGWEATLGWPVAVAVAEIVMKHVQERTLDTCRHTIPLCLRYVADNFTAVHKDEIDAFHGHLM